MNFYSLLFLLIVGVVSFALYQDFNLSGCRVVSISAGIGICTARR